MIFKPPKIDLREVPISLLSYIGDEVMALYVKLRYINLLKPSEIDKKAKEVISKYGQARILDEIIQDLSEEERSVVRRAMNSKAATRHGNDPDYRKSTGLEALVGYLYLKGDEERICQLMEVVL